MSRVVGATSNTGVVGATVNTVSVSEIKNKQFTNVTNAIDRLNTFVATNHDLTSYIYFKVNNFELDTRSINTFKHYAISLQNQKTCVGQGNKFTLKIVFHQDFSDPKIDINSFEKNLSDAQSNRNACKLKYGYINGESSPEYKGILLQYEVTANKQIVEYTLYGVTGVETSSLTTVNWYPPIENLDTQNSTIGKLFMKAQKVPVPDPNNSTEINEYKNMLDKLNRNYTGMIHVDPFEALARFIYDYNELMERISKEKDNIKVYKFKIIDNTGYNTDNSADGLKGVFQPVVISPCRNQTVTEYIEYLIGMFVKKTGEDYNLIMKYYLQNNEVTDRIVFQYKLSDTENNTINIELYRLRSDNEDKTYTFSNYTHTNNLLLNYTLKYDGTVALTVKSSYSDDTEESLDNENLKVYINNEGKVVQKAIITRDMFVGGSLDYIDKQLPNTWMDKISCSNNCTMKTVGMPFEIAVGTVFEIQSYIGDVQHHTSGRCYVVSAIDEIKNNSFTSSFTMIRLPGRSSGVDNI